MTNYSFTILYLRCFCSITDMFSKIMVLLNLFFVLHHTWASAKNTCTTKFDGKDVEIEYGETKWLTPCYFCWCYESTNESGCNSVDCPTWTCPDELKLTYLDGKCCPSCLPDDQ